LPYENPSRIVQVWSKRRYGRVVYTSSENIRAIEERAHSFAQFATYVEGGSNLIAGDGPESLQVTFVSGNFFTVLGARPLLGRPILPEDDQPGRDQVVVISYALWQSHFGADPQILGKQISLVATPSNAFTAARSPKPYSVIGVMPPIFPFPNRGEILLPIASWNIPPSAILIARLNDNASLSTANAELQTIAAGLASDNAKTNKNLGLSVTTFRDRITEDFSTGLLILLSCVSFLLLLACVNVGNLLIARSWGRQREIAIRETLGATRPRLLRQFLTESVLLALFGGALGLVIASWSKNLLLAIAPGGTPRIDEVALNWPVLGYTLGISLLAGILFGVAPAILVSRVSPLTGIKQTPAGGLATFSSHCPGSLRNALIAAEIALAFLLVTGSALAARSFLRLVNVNMGFSPSHVLTMWVNFGPGSCRKLDACKNAINDVLYRVQSLPGVESAAFGTWRPLSSAFGSSIQIDGRSEPATATFQQITPQYFSAMGIPVLKGRVFNPTDTPSSPRVAIVDAALADRYFAGNPLGKRLSGQFAANAQPTWFEIVGEVGNTRDVSPSVSPGPAFYVPYSQADMMFEHVLIVRTAANPASLTAAIRRQIWAVDKDAPVPGAETMDQIIYEKTAEPRFRTSLLGAFGLLALVLAIIGIYGVTSYSLAQRTYEIGVRIALGAQPRNIARLIFREGSLVAAVGISVGVVASFALTRYLGSLLFEIKPLDPATFLAVAVALLATDLVACYIPARRAMRVDPITAMRCE
jgi:putative ABC transport system permease protein